MGKSKPSLDLDTPVQYLKGIGPKRSSYLSRIGVTTIGDLLTLVPRRYLDYSNLAKIAELKVGDAVTVVGQIIARDVKKTRSKGEVVILAVSDSSGLLTCRWFNRPDLKKKFRVGDLVILSGEVSFYYGKQMVNPNYQIVDPDKNDMPIYAGSIIPIYPLTEGMNLWNLRRSIMRAIECCLDKVKETLPEYILKKHNLLKMDEAIQKLHFPETMEEANKARERFVYEEIFFFELALALRRALVKGGDRGLTLKEKGYLTKRLIELLPFSLTEAQKRVIEEIGSDMARDQTMYRLLQGDVGSGKTVVAIYAALIAVENGYQAALMAPTEILAEQHYQTYQPILRELGVSSGLLTGSLPSTQKEAVLKGLADGSIKIIFGTHALIEERVNFAQLGLVIVDEQHRFGVVQRALLSAKGESPDFLVISATPIPRTLSLTLYGDLDISQLDEKPPGRKEIETIVVEPTRRAEIYRFIDRKIEEKNQVFYICPLIKESDRLGLKSVERAMDEISRVFVNRKVEILHGRIPTRDRKRIMEEFRRGKIDILIATTVVEVGVDIPNANIMVIEHPERFGIAQLHQLRGRIGRGETQGYCILFLPENYAPEWKRRIEYFASTTDGFELATKDLEIRGPGELLGKRQHGLPDLKITDITRDTPLLFKARRDAFQIVEFDPELNDPEHAVLKEQLARRFEAKLELLGIG
ncbi:DNA helicase RecG [candidate division WOR-3 bacterium]|uniref:ATP-dependent DNA helicase RecG n=1 Tax=candidate division WOR-3 bacterium TaxID=2052148 RepID=A0A660SKF8_UNCW3|nr:MAG: DNA helicase RecG [candidate division WOR-3 bacterium]